MDSFFTRISEANKTELYLPNRQDRVYYTELNEWYTTGAFRNYSVKIVLDKEINYRVGRKEITVSADKCLLAVQQPEVEAYYSSREPVKSICVDIDTDTIAEVYTVIKTKEACFDNYLDNYFSTPGFTEDTFFYRNSSFASRITKLTNDIKTGKEIALNKDWFYGICEEIIYQQYGKYISYSNLSCVKDATKKEILRRLQAAKEFIDANYLQVSSMHEIANAACMSDYHFFRCFRMAYKTTPYKYVLQKRLMHAQLMMREMHSAVLKEIAALCGFPDLATFSKAYKRCFKTTPSMYKRSA